MDDERLSKVEFLEQQKLSAFSHHGLKILLFPVLPKLLKEGKTENFI
jgi:hypothetical protein